MKLVSLLVLALVGCKSHKPAAPAAGSAAAAAPAQKLASPTAAPELPKYTAPEVPEGEVEPAQAVQTAGSAAVPVVIRDPVAREVDRLDANHDGKLTTDEARKSLGDDVDTNGDGEISRDELAEAMRAKRLRARAGATH